MQQEARQYIAAVGGSDNLTGIDACITRLRLNVKDASVVNDAYAKHLGASGVIRLNKQSVQVIVGTRAEIVASAMRDVLAQGPVAAYAGRHTDNAVSTEKHQKNRLIMMPKSFLKWSRHLMVKWLH